MRATGLLRPSPEPLDHLPLCRLISMKAVGTVGTPTTGSCLQSSRPPLTEHPINNSGEPMGMLRALPEWCSTRALLPLPGFLSSPSLHDGLYHRSSALSPNMPSPHLHPLSGLPSSLGRGKDLGDEARREEESQLGSRQGMPGRDSNRELRGSVKEGRSDHKGDGKTER